IPVGHRLLCRSHGEEIRRRVVSDLYPCARGQVGPQAHGGLREDGIAFAAAARVRTQRVGLLARLPRGWRGSAHTLPGSLRLLAGTLHRERAGISCPPVCAAATSSRKSTPSIKWSAKCLALASRSSALATT